MPAVCWPTCLQELEDALQQLSGKSGEDAAAAVSERQGLEAAVRQLEGRLGQARMDLARSRDELRGAEQGQVTARAELEAAQQHGAQLRAQLGEEQLRASKLRSELAALSGNYAKDQKQKSGLLADTQARMHVSGRKQGVRRGGQRAREGGVAALAASRPNHLYDPIG
jgi:chromosome segregation ATPase